MEWTDVWDRSGKYGPRSGRRTGGKDYEESIKNMHPNYVKWRNA